MTVFPNTPGNPGSLAAIIAAATSIGSSTDGANDLLFVLDVSASTLKKVTPNALVTSGGGVADGATLSTGLTFPVAGLHILDTDASHDLIVSPGSNLTADRTLTITTGDADRTLTINGNVTLNDWFDQSVKAANSPQFAAINIGHATDTTLARASAGVLTVEGNTIYAASGTDVALADGGTGASLTDPEADRIMFWDDSAGAMTWLEVGSGLSITGTTIAATGVGGGGANTALSNLSSVAINTTLIPGTSDGAALGSTSKMWSDLFLASGAVVNFNNGNVTITHSANALAFAGATSGYSFDDDLKTTSDNAYDIGASNLAFRAAYARKLQGGQDASLIMTITANGASTDAGLIKLQPDNGDIQLGGGDTAAILMFMEPSGGGTSYVGLKSPALAGTTTYTLPNAFPASNGYVLSCTTAGVMSWAAPSGGGLSHFTEAQSTSSPNNTVYVDSFTAGGAATNIDAAIVPKGSGAVLAQVPDGTSAGGNKRGTNAVDLQCVRGTASQVASGNYSAILGGTHNTASGAYSCVPGGNSNTASGDGSVAIGSSCEASGHFSVAVGASALASHHREIAFASSSLSDRGDNQSSLVHWCKQTANGTQAEIFIDNSSQRFTVASDVTYGFEIHVVARRTDANGEWAYWIIRGTIANDGGTTALGDSGVSVTLVDEKGGFGAACSVTAEADNTNDALVPKVTGAPSKTINWTAAGLMVKTKG